MYKNFFYSSELNFKKFLSYLPNKKNVILDFGCGNGIFDPQKKYKKKIKIIKMTDKNKLLKKSIKNKYKKNNKFIWSDNINTHYNVVFICSVVQYLSFKEYRKLINFFLKKKTELILISDIPKYPRIIEAFFLIFINPYKLVRASKYLFKKKYLKTSYFFKKYDQLLIYNNNYIYKMQSNLNDDKLRYSLIIQKKKK